ncbi:hypothetical protein K2Z83_27835 [Oscillochloris sp. ZM17-4]|uniref:hypothetical protein n=1 Tax=Oscillochloris sp. ZM17-4 TaxID=2866714 RepID=UPI001C73C480|nr:hypothetical protein [Oscillochloris sp. ZM17-4]MBX0331468.1 hypothetical protein [Oscillochloris sp. ZM17-4]
MQSLSFAELPIDLDDEQRTYVRDITRMRRARDNTERFDYLMRHMVAHLQKADATEQLYQLLVGNSAWMQVKREYLASDLAYLEDLDQAIQSVIGQASPEGLIRLIGLHTARQVVNLRTNAHTDEQLRALVWLGRVDEAVDYATIRPNPEQRFVGLMEIYKDLRYRKQAIPKHLLDTACDIAAALPDPSTQQSFLRTVALALSEMGHPDRAAAALHRNHFNSIDDCLGIAKDLARRGLVHEAQGLLHHFAASAGRHHWYEWLQRLSDVDISQAPDFISAPQPVMLSETHTISDEELDQLHARSMYADWSRALQAIAHAMALAGRYDEALATAYKMPDVEVRAETLAEIAAIQSGIRPNVDPGADGSAPPEDINQTLAHIRTIQSVDKRFDAYKELLSQLDPVPEAVVAALVAELPAIRAIANGQIAAYLLGCLALYLARAGDSQATTVLDESLMEGMASVTVPEPRTLTAAQVGVELQARLEGITQVLRIAEAQQINGDLDAQELRDWLDIGLSYITDTHDLRQTEQGALLHAPIVCGVATTVLDLIACMRALDLEHALPVTPQMAQLLSNMATTLLISGGTQGSDCASYALDLALGIEYGHIASFAAIRSQNLMSRVLPLVAGLKGWRAKRLFGAILVALVNAQEVSIERAMSLIQAADALAAVGVHHRANLVIERVIRDFTGVNNELQADVSMALAQHGYIEQALRLADTIQLDGHRSDALAEIAASLSLMGNQRADEIFEQALTLARGFPLSRDRALGLRAIAIAATRAGDGRANQLFDEALAAARAPDETLRTAAKESASRSNTEAHIAQSLVDLGQIDRAMAVIEAIPLYETFFRARAQRSIAEGLARANRFAEAIQVADEIAYDRTRERTDTRLQLAQIMAQKGYIAEALTVLSSCTPGEFLGTLPALIPTLARHGLSLVGGSVQEVARITGWVLVEWFQAAKLVARYRSAPDPNQSPSE